VWFRQEFDPTAWLKAQRGSRCIWWPIPMIRQASGGGVSERSVFGGDCAAGAVDRPIGMRVTGWCTRAECLDAEGQDGYLRAGVFDGGGAAAVSGLGRRRTRGGWICAILRWTRISEGSCGRRCRCGRRAGDAMLFVPGRPWNWPTIFWNSSEGGIIGLHNSGSGGRSGRGGRIWVCDWGLREHRGRRTLDSVSGSRRNWRGCCLMARGSTISFTTRFTTWIWKRGRNWFSDHRREMELFGKADVAPPEVAVLISAETERYSRR